MYQRLKLPSPALLLLLLDPSSLPPSIMTTKVTIEVIIANDIQLHYRMTVRNNKIINDINKQIVQKINTSSSQNKNGPQVLRPSTSVDGLLEAFHKCCSLNS